MSKVKELYMEMMDSAMDCALQGMAEEETKERLIHEFKEYGIVWGDSIAKEAVESIQAYHNDMMNMHSFNQETNYE